MQATITVAMAMFSIGVLWHRISANAAAMRGTTEEIRTEQRANAAWMRDALEEIRNEQRAMAAKLETILKK